MANPTERKTSAEVAAPEAHIGFRDLATDPFAFALILAAVLLALLV